MSSKVDVSIIDYGIGNILSVSRALEYCGADVTVTRNIETILSSSRVVLPGVGAYSQGMAELCRFNLDKIIKEIVLTRVPVLGICLGMQMLLEESEEFGMTKGLGLISGKVVPIPNNIFQGNVLKIPHIGWNELEVNSKNKMLDGISNNEAFYFVHSYMAVLNSTSHCIANSRYGDIRIPAVIGKDNVYGCQYHPEKSGEAGLRILKNFISL